MIERLRPKWMLTIGSLWKSNAYVRTRCQSCGLQLRVDVNELAAAYGGATTLIGRRDRCRAVGCSGTASYFAARRPGAVWVGLE